MVTLDRLRVIRWALTTAATDQIDVVAFGSPHASLQECLRLAELMRDQHARGGMQVYVTTSRGVKEILARSGALATIEAFGTSVVADTCIAVAPLVRPGAKVLMTEAQGSTRALWARDHWSGVDLWIDRRVCQRRDDRSRRSG